MTEWLAIKTENKFVTLILHRRGMVAGFAGNAYTPARAAKPTRRLMKRPTVQHGGARMEREKRKRDNHSQCGSGVYIYNIASLINV